MVLLAETCSEFCKNRIVFIIKVVVFDWIALEWSKERSVYRKWFMQFCEIIMPYTNEKYLPWRKISHKYINTEYVTVGVKQAPRYRRHVTHNQFSCSQPSEYRGPTPYYRPVITPDCAFMMIRWWWYNERTRHLSPQSKHRRCLQVFLLISVNNPT